MEKNMNEDEIIGTFKLEDGSKYIFMSDNTIYKEAGNGKIIEIELTPKNIKKIKEEIGQGETDIIK